MANSTCILLIRHATTAKVGNSLTGWLPGIPLDQPGRAQAEQLPQRLQNVVIDEIWSSPLQRALETAQPLATSRSMEIHQNPDFGEINFGSWQGRYLKDLSDDGTFQLFNQYRSGTRAPGGELMLETQARMVRGLLRLAEANAQDDRTKTIAVFSHADAIKCAIMHALGTPIDFHHRLEIGTASISSLEFFPETVRVLQVNVAGNIEY